jgi:hypothetical protein
MNGLIALNLTQELSTLGSSIVDERLNILHQTVHRLFHLPIKGLRLVQSVGKLFERLVGLFILG